MAVDTKPVKADWVKELERDAKVGRDLIDVLSKYCGERGRSEGAVQTLKRIIRERNAWMSRAVPHQHGRTEIDRDNLRGTLDWIREKVSPYLIGPGFDPRDRATENLIATLLERYDAQYERLKYLVSVAPALCPTCGRIREHHPCDGSGTLYPCSDQFHYTRCTCGAPDGFRHLRGCPLREEEVSGK